MLIHRVTLWKDLLICILVSWRSKSAKTKTKSQIKRITHQRKFIIRFVRYRDVKRSVQSNPVQDRSVLSKDGLDLGLKFGLGPFWTMVLGPVPRLSLGTGPS